MFGDASVGIFSGVLTLLILVGSEIVPKTLGATYWKLLAPLVARVAQLLIVPMWPLVKLAEWIAKLLTPERAEASVSREELVAMADVGHREGVVAERESRVVKNLLRLAATREREVMTPHQQVRALPQDMPASEVAQRFGALEFSRPPVYVEDREARRYTGYVLKDEVALALDETGAATGVITMEDIIEGVARRQSWTRPMRVPRNRYRACHSLTA